MEHKAFVPLLVLMLGFSIVLSTAAVPTSRSLATTMGVNSVQELYVQDLVNKKVDPEMLNTEERYVEGRMDIESSDYPGTGANNHHEPKTPGRV